jgi:hypothetical protein
MLEKIKEKLDEKLQSDPMTYSYLMVIVPMLLVFGILVILSN